MKHVILFAASAAAALSLAACQKKEAAPEAAAPPAAPEAAAPAAEVTPAEVVTPIEPPATPTPPGPPGPPSTEALIKGVTLVDMYQVQAGKIAAEKGQSQAVKDFGKQIATDHAAMTNQMKAVFAATKQPIPTELGPRGKGMLDALNAAAPADFDKVFLTQQKAAQEAELALLKGYADGGESKDIKPAAAKAVPKVQAHLDKVNELAAAPPPAPAP